MKDRVSPPSVAACLVSWASSDAVNLPGDRLNQELPVYRNPQLQLLEGAPGSFGSALAMPSHASLIALTAPGRAGEDG